MQTMNDAIQEMRVDAEYAAHYEGHGLGDLLDLDCWLCKQLWRACYKREEEEHEESHASGTCGRNPECRVCETAHDEHVVTGAPYTSQGYTDCAFCEKVFDYYARGI
jgi:hypothetical protein